MCSYNYRIKGLNKVISSVCSKQLSESRWISSFDSHSKVHQRDIKVILYGGKFLRSKHAQCGEGAEGEAVLFTVLRDLHCYLVWN